MVGETGDQRGKEQKFEKLCFSSYPLILIVLYDHHLVETEFYGDLKKKKNSVA